MKTSKNRDRPPIKYDDIKKLEKSYIKEVDNNPLYSLEVDPENKYNFDIITKKFINSYIDVEDVYKVCDELQLPIEEGFDIFHNYNVRSEINRLNSAIYHSQFKHRILDLNERSSLLTSYIVDYNVPRSKRLSSSDKLKAIKLMDEIDLLKQQKIFNDEPVKTVDLEKELEKLSVDTIKNYLNTSKKNKVLDELNKNENLGEDEKKYIESLPLPELLKLTEDISAKEKKK